MKNLTQNEAKALRAICYDCDELDGWGFTRISDMIEAIAEAFDGNFQKAGGYLSTLLSKSIIDVDAKADEVWIAPEYFEAYC